MSLMNVDLAMELVKDVGGRPQKSLSEQQVQEVKTLAGVLSKQQLAAYFGMCENTLNEICKAVKYPASQCRTK